MTVNGPMTRSNRVATLDEAKAQFQMSCIACARGLTASVFWRVSDRDRDGVSRYRRCRPWHSSSIRSCFSSSVLDCVTQRMASSAYCRN